MEDMAVFQQQCLEVIDYLNAMVYARVTQAKEQEKPFFIYRIVFKASQVDYAEQTVIPEVSIDSRAFETKNQLEDFFIDNRFNGWGTYVAMDLRGEAPVEITL